MNDKYDSHITLDGTFEKGFASLARSDAVVETGCHIAAHQTQTFGSVFVFEIVLKKKDNRKPNVVHHYSY